MNSFHISPNLTTGSKSSPRVLSSLSDRWVQIWNQLWQHIVDNLTLCSEPHVQQETDRRGHLYWHGYDPATNRHMYGSEAELRVWLEQRYSL